MYRRPTILYLLQTTPLLSRNRWQFEVVLSKQPRPLVGPTQVSENRSVAKQRPNPRPKLVLQLLLVEDVAVKPVPSLLQRQRDVQPLARLERILRPA
jgi:hypothetical protein